MGKIARQLVKTGASSDIRAGGERRRLAQRNFIIISCYRIIGTNGDLTSYAGGTNENMKCWNRSTPA